MLLRWSQTCLHCILYVFSGPESNDNKVSFQEHRRAHYDEYRKIKELRQQGSMFSEVDEEDEKERSESDRKTSQDCDTSLTGGMGAIGIQECGFDYNPQVTWQLQTTAGDSGQCLLSLGDYPRLKIGGKWVVQGPT
eukprot:Gb_27056 [translate_table: standard]